MRCASQPQVRSCIDTSHGNRSNDTPPAHASRYCRASLLITSTPTSFRVSQYEIMTAKGRVEGRDAATSSSNSSGSPKVMGALGRRFPFAAMSSRMYFRAPKRDVTTCGLTIIRRLSSLSFGPAKHPDAGRVVVAHATIPEPTTRRQRFGRSLRRAPKRAHRLRFSRKKSVFLPPQRAGLCVSCHGRLGPRLTAGPAF